MKPRYRIYKRENGTFYKRDTESGARTSLNTKCRKEAQKIVEAENQAISDPVLSQHMAEAFLSVSDPQAGKRTWQDVMNAYQEIGADSTRERKKGAFRAVDFNPIRNKLVLRTSAEDFHRVLESGKSSPNAFLIQLQNYALDVGWLPRPVLPRRRFPKPSEKRPKRAITAAEHLEIVRSERQTERRRYYQMVWMTGGAQTDVAELTAEDFDLENGVLCFYRNKTKQACRLAISDEMRKLLKALPKSGALFPNLGKLPENVRAKHFRYLRKKLGIKGVTLHSYRYSWAERAYEAGIPERLAMAALGHSSRAIHRAYSKSAKAVCPAFG